MQKLKKILKETFAQVVIFGNNSMAKYNKEEEYLFADNFIFIFLKPLSEIEKTRKINKIIDDLIKNKDEKIYFEDFNKNTLIFYCLAFDPHLAFKKLWKYIENARPAFLENHKNENGLICRTVADK